MSQTLGLITGLAFSLLIFFLVFVGIEGCATDMARF